MTFLKDLKLIFTNPHSINNEQTGNVIKKIIFYILILYSIQLSKTFFVAWIDYIFKSPSVIKSIGESSLFKMAVIIPIYEELSFRLFLKPKRVNFLISLLTVFVVLLNINLLISDLWFYFFVFALLFAGVKFDIQKLNGENNVKSNLALVYISSVLFGMLHLFNFKTIEEINLIVALYVFSKILSGFLFSLVRLRFGIITSIILHLLINSTGYILMLLFKN